MSFQGITYSLFGRETGTDKYYRLIMELTDHFLERYPDPQMLLEQVQNAGGISFLPKN